MIDINYIKNESSKFKNYYLEINGITDLDSICFEKHEKIFLNSEKVINILLNEKISGIFNNINAVQIPMYDEFFPHTITENDWSYIVLSNENDNFNIIFSFQYDTDYWKFPYSLLDFTNQLNQICNDSSLIKYSQIDESIQNGFELSKSITSINSLFKNNIENFHKEVNNLFESAINKLSEKDSEKFITFEFSVREEIKIACEQYLTYFIQFLEDVGIKANASLSDDTEKILFSVKPVDKDIALENIRKALNIYIKLPDVIDDINNYSQNLDIAALQLKSNILHLNSQLVLAKATNQALNTTIQLKDAIIQTKDVTIQSLNTNLENNLSSCNTNEEELLNGFITITDYETNGFKINLPKIFQILKRKLK